MSTMTMEPCPFCGKAGPFDQWPCEWLDATEANVVRCPHCHGAAPLATWNTRANLSQPAQAVDVGAIREVIDRLRINPSITAQECADSLAVALSGEKAGPVGDGWQETIKEAIDCLDDVAQFKGNLKVGVYRHIGGKLQDLLPASPTPDKEGM